MRSPRSSCNLSKHCRGNHGFRQDQPRRDLPLASEAKLLRIAFLSSSLLSLLSRIAQGQVNFQEADKRLIDHGAGLLEGIDQAWRFLYRSEVNLFPSSDLVDTVAEIASRDPSADPDRIVRMLDICKAVFAAVRAQEGRTLELDRSNIADVQAFLRAIHAASLGKLEQSSTASTLGEDASSSCLEI